MEAGIWSFHTLGPEGHILLTKCRVGARVIGDVVTNPVSRDDDDAFISMTPKSIPAEASERVLPLASNLTSRLSVYRQEVASQLVSKRSIGGRG